MIVVCDIETDRLENPSRIWCIVCKELGRDNVQIFEEPDKNPEQFLRFRRNVSGWIGHNFIGFDRDVLNLLLATDIPSDACIDTLVVSRVLDYSRPNGHSLEAWGEKLGHPKDTFSDYSRCSEELIARCVQDVKITEEVFNELRPFIYSKKWSKAFRIEHDMQVTCNDLHNNGFHFNLDKARGLKYTITEELNVLDAELALVFPPRAELLREITPRATKHGTINRGDFRWLKDGDLSDYSVGCPFSLISWEPFNAASPKQIVTRLNEAGWKPTERTKGHLQAVRDRDKSKLAHYDTYGWKVSEENLKTLPSTAPAAAHKLARRILLASRLGDLDEWEEAYVPSTGRIHGRFNPIGAWTGRMSHNSPNMANIPTGESLFAEEMRGMWGVDSNKLLVGVDAEGIQLRVLAHYVNDDRFTHSIVSGRKEDKTDPHSLNQRALGSVCRTRDDAKTFIYAWLLGAGTRKVSEILSCSLADAADAVTSFITFYPGLQLLKRDYIPFDAARGYFEGFDGRYVKIWGEDFGTKEHLALAGYLQSGETIIMKHACRLWQSKLRKEGIWFKLVDFVHDEWQTEVENNPDLARYIAQVQMDSIREIGEELKLNCPMSGSFKIGQNWSETH